MQLLRLSWVALAACAGLAIASQPASAQGPAASTPPELQRQYDQAFEEMLKKPADLDVLFKFATLASQTGDLEQAISALERMLLIDPNLPRVRLELGVLYYRLASYEIARTYIEAALKAPNLPADVRAKAEQFMAQIANQQKPSRFAGEAFFGFRYQSNANLGPASSSVRLFGQPANLNQAATGTADWGAVSSLQLRHSYDFGTQDKATMETLFAGYGNRQFQVAAANVWLVDVISGPRFQILSDTFEDVTLKPFGAGGAIWVNDVLYYASYGGGLEVAAALSDRVRSTSTVVWRRHDHADNSYLPTNSQFKGTEYSANSVLQYQISESVTIFGIGSGQRYQTEQAPWQSYVLIGVGGGISYRFLDPLLGTGLPWTVALTGTQQWWQYDAADVTVDPSTSRRQIDTITNLTLGIPFDNRTTFTVSGGRFLRQADIPNYAFDNANVMFGVNWRF